MKQLFQKLSSVFVSLVTLFLFTTNVLAAGFGGSPIADLSDNTVGNTSNYRVDFRTSGTGALVASDELSITFPAGYDVSGSSLAGYSGITGSASYSISGQEVILTLDPGASIGNDTFVSINLSGIVNTHTAADDNTLVIESTHLGATVDGPTQTNFFTTQPRAPNQGTLVPSGDTQMTPGSTLNLTVTAQDEYGNVTPNEDALWTNSNGNFSLNTTTGTTNNLGQHTVTLTAPLTAEEITTVGVTVGGVVHNITLTSGDIYVDHGPATSLTITPVGPLAMTSDDSQAFTATAHDDYGNAWDVTGSVTWNENDPTGSFTGNTYNAGTVGSWTINATYNALTSNNVTANVSHGAVVSIGINPVGPLSMTADQSQAFTATATDADGNTWDVTNTVIWNENDPAGSFTANTYNAGQVGSWTINANIGVVFSNNVTANVTHGAITGLLVTPDPVNLTADDTQAFTATANDADGNTWDVTDLATWSTTDPSGNVDAFGVYNPVTVGTWAVNADYSGFNDNATVNVSHGVITGLLVTPTPVDLTADQTQQFTATANDADGNTWDVTNLATWTTTDPSGTVVNGLYSPAVVGSWTVDADYSGYSCHTDVNITHGVITNLNITPVGPLTMTADDSQAFVATANDADGNTWDETANVTWHENDPWGLFIGDTYQAGQVGSWTIYASLGIINSNNVTANVSHGLLNTLDINPKNIHLANAGDTQAYTLTAYDVDGNSWDVTGLSTFGTDDPNGNFTGNVYTGGQVGTHDISGSYGGYTVHTDATVDDHDVVTSITISPVGPLNLTADDTQDFNVTAHDNYGNAWDVTGLATYTDNDPTGYFSGNTYNAGTVGSWTIYASYSGYDTANVTANVTHGIAVSVDINPTYAALTSDQTQQFTATATDNDGNTWDVTNLATWTTTDPSGTVVNGLYNPAIVGSWTVDVSFNGYSDNANVDITHGAVVSIGINPVGPLSMTADQSQAFTATATDADGNTWDVTNTVIWNENDPAGSFTANTYNAGQVGSWTINANIGVVFSNNVTANVTHSAAIMIVVTPDPSSILAGNTETYTVTAMDADGNIFDVTGLATYQIVEAGHNGSWAGNTYTSHTAGTWTVRATYNALTDDAVLNVNHNVATSIVLTPDPSTILAGNTETYTATATDAYGNSWDVTGLATYQIVEAGHNGSWAGNVYTSHTAGTWTVRATYNALTDDAILNVNHNVATSLAITPVGPLSMTSDQSQAFIATATDAYGNSWDETANVTWNENDPWGSFTANTYNAGQVGSWTISATLGIINSNNVTVNVSHGVAQSILVTPDPVNLTADQTQQFTATATDTDGNTWDVTNTATWNTTDPIGSVSLSGLYSAGQVGNWLVTATLNALNDNASVTVTPGVVASIDIEPSVATNVSADTHQITITATLRDADGNLVADGTTVNWTRSNLAFTLGSASSTTINGVATVVLTTTTIAGNNSTVTATSNGVTDVTGTITVIHGATTNISITPNTVNNATSGSNYNFNSTAFDQYGNSWDISTIASYTLDSDDAFGTLNTLTTNVRYTAGQIGTRHVTANYQGFTATATVNVANHNANISSVQIVNNISSIMVGYTHGYQVRFRDSYGNSWDGTSSLNDTNWSFNIPGCATINSSSVMTGQLICSGVIITVNFGGRSDTDTFNVIAAPVGSLSSQNNSISGNNPAITSETTTALASGEGVTATETNSITTPIDGLKTSKNYLIYILIILGALMIYVGYWLSSKSENGNNSTTA